MKKSILSLAVATAAIVLSQTAQADRVKGSAKADFNNNELQVPCVQIEGYSEAADGQFFDIVLKRRGKSFNYELTFAEPEDADMRAELANYAVFIDEDDDDDEVEDSEDDDDSDGSDDDAGATDLFASCEVRHVEGEQTRYKAKVKAKNLEAGDYYAVLISGDNTITSETRTISDDEVEFEFDSDADDVAEGAEALEPGFIVDKEVTAELYTAADELLLSETVGCLVKG